MNKETEKPSKMGLNMNFYSEKAKTAAKPNDTEYGFLYERNKKYMNNIAITFGGLKVTYEELHTKIDEYAKALYKRGVRENDIIALSVANTPEAIYISYALNKLGAIICPINPLDMDYKIMQDLKVVRPKMFIGINDSYKKFKNASKDIDIDVILFPAVRSLDNNIIKTLYGVKQIISGNVLLSLDSKLDYVLKKGKSFEDAIYPIHKDEKIGDIMFTGGSSGTHKGVMLSENGLNCVTKSLDYVTELEPGEIFMGNLPTFMAFGKLAMHYALCKSLNVNLTLKALPKDFKEELYRIKPAGVFAGPIQWECFLNSIFGEISNKNEKIDFSLNQNTDYIKYLESLKAMLRKADTSKLDLSWLKMGVSGGEQLKMFTELLCSTVFEELGAPDVLWNGLGMTEMWAPVAVKMGKKNTNGTVGAVIPYNNQMIIDPITKEELGINKEGLLCVNGPGMMLGYYNNPEETKNSFIEKDGEKWLLTGDIAKILPTGEIEYIDRAKRSFVCGIENIYPQRIENLLSQIPEIRESIVTKVKDNDLQYVPKYHISIYEQNCDIEKLQEKIELLIKSTLGKNNLPRFYEFYYEPLLRTANGKLDPKPYQKEDNEKHKILIRKK